MLDPDGEHIYLSAMDGHIYRGRLDGGAVERVTPEDGAWHFLHGVSPDRTRLAYVHIDDLAHPGRLAVMEPHGQPVLVDTGTGHLDGPEWSPDGAWIYANTEAFTDEPGHAQLARIADAGGPMERLVTSDTVDWFPHLSPNAQHAAYISFPPGTLGHPPDVDVEVRVVATTDWSDAAAAIPSVRRSRDDQRQQLGAGQQSVRVRRIPVRLGLREGLTSSASEPSGSPRHCSTRGGGWLASGTVSRWFLRVMAGAIIVAASAGCTSPSPSTESPVAISSTAGGPVPPPGLVRRRRCRAGPRPRRDTSLWEIR